MDKEKRLEELEDFAKFEGFALLFSGVYLLSACQKGINEQTIEEIFAFYGSVHGLMGIPPRAAILAMADVSKAMKRAIYIGWYLIMALCFYAMR